MVFFRTSVQAVYVACLIKALRGSPIIAVIAQPIGNNAGADASEGHCVTRPASEPRADNNVTTDDASVRNMRDANGDDDDGAVLREREADQAASYRDVSLGEVINPQLRRPANSSPVHTSSNAPSMRNMRPIGTSPSEPRNVSRNAGINQKGS
jgi:hypothetical protein